MISKKWRIDSQLSLLNFATISITPDLAAATKLFYYML